ncbi:hypothetical protein [Streptomyces sp. MJM1172]|uniref:hypothetical protein n=1 Tax=Streptomyces sp. MJM1172 TaxID=1703926 RepID=UPI000AD7042C|nr:hypothetical protein [Streptomyces sp. MJM1172]
MTTPNRITSDGVSPETAKALRSAMQGLFAGQPQRTDGRLTRENLWREAQVSRATMNRAQPILAEWDARIAEHGKTTVGEARRDTEISRLRKRLSEKTTECTRLQNRLQAAATAIAALHHANQALRDELAQRAGHVVVPLARRPSPSEGPQPRQTRRTQTSTGKSPTQTFLEERLSRFIRTAKELPGRRSAGGGKEAAPSNQAVRMAGKRTAGPPACVGAFGQGLV